MSDKPSNAERSTPIRVAGNGDLSLDVGPGGFGAGFAQLMDLNPPLFTPKSLPADETTRVGFIRTADAIARALVMARDRFGD